MPLLKGRPTLIPRADPLRRNGGEAATAALTLPCSELLRAKGADQGVTIFCRFRHARCLGQPGSMLLRPGVRPLASRILLRPNARGPVSRSQARKRKRHRSQFRGERSCYSGWLNVLQAAIVPLSAVEMPWRSACDARGTLCSLQTRFRVNLYVPEGDRGESMARARSLGGQGLPARPRAPSRRYSLICTTSVANG